MRVSKGIKNKVDGKVMNVEAKVNSRRVYQKSPDPLKVKVRNKDNNLQSTIKNALKEEKMRMGRNLVGQEQMDVLNEDEVDEMIKEAMKGTEMAQNVPIRAVNLSKYSINMDDIN